MVNGTDNSDLVAKGFWGGFVKSFKKGAARKKRSNDSATASPVGVEIDTVLLMSDETNSTDTPKIESALTNAPGLDFEAGSIKSKMLIINTSCYMVTLPNIVSEYIEILLRLIFSMFFSAATPCYPANISTLVPAAPSHLETTFSRSATFIESGQYIHFTCKRTSSSKYREYKETGLLLKNLNEFESKRILLYRKKC